MNAAMPGMFEQPGLSRVRAKKARLPCPFCQTEALSQLPLWSHYLDACCPLSGKMYWYRDFFSVCLCRNFPRLKAAVDKSGRAALEPDSDLGERLEKFAAKQKQESGFDVTTSQIVRLAVDEFLTAKGFPPKKKKGQP